MAEQHYTRQQQQQQQQQQPLTQKLFSSAPTSRQTVKFVTASTIGTVLLVLSGLTLTITVLSVIMATPLLVLFSPVLVPAVITAFLIASGFVFSGGCGVAALSVLSWIYQYVTGKNPPGADQLDQARMRIANAARDVKDRAKENVPYGEQRIRDVTGGHATYQS